MSAVHFPDRFLRHFLRPRSDTLPNTDGATAESQSVPSDKHSRWRLAADERRPSTNSGKVETFFQWLRWSFLDILIMIAFLIFSYAVHQVQTVQMREFPIVTRQTSETVYPKMAYSLTKSRMSVMNVALATSLTPIIVMVFFQISVRSLWDLNSAIVGFLCAFKGALVIHVIFKWLVGGFRPYFLTVCNPDMSLLTTDGFGFLRMMHDPLICRGDIRHISQGMKSFPSGRTTAAFASFIYLALYMNGKLKIFSNRHSSLWRNVLVLAPVVCATYIAGTMVNDRQSQWYDIIAGAILGTVSALVAYRAAFASVGDFRFNHIPLPNKGVFVYGPAPNDEDKSGLITSSHKPDAWSGAPFDALNSTPARLVTTALPSESSQVMAPGHSHSRRAPQAQVEVTASEPPLAPSQLDGMSSFVDLPGSMRYSDALKTPQSVLLRVNNNQRWNEQPFSPSEERDRAWREVVASLSSE